jgi:NAD(P)-dependent dehydrogenase (short-subunit alcohol dehydrogenase family)
VAAVDRDADALSSVSEATGALAMTADVTDPSAVDDAIARVEAELGPLAVVANVAGITGSSEATECHLTPIDEWLKVLSVNLTGPFLVCRAALPGMLARGHGTIVNIASVAAIVAFPGRCAYTASKGGVLQLTRSLAADYAGRGLRAVAICPGIVDTPMTAWRLDHPTLRAEVLERIPQGRVATADEVAEAVALIALGGLPYMNGAALVLDGGWTAV